MERIGRVATWLELAVAPEWRRQAAQIQVHEVGQGKDACYTVSIDGRCVCTGNGQLTTFRGRPAVERFLAMLRVDDFEIGEPHPDLCEYPRGHYCLGLNQQKSLCPCDECVEECNACCPTQNLVDRGEWMAPVPGWRGDASCV